MSLKETLIPLLRSVPACADLSEPAIIFLGECVGLVDIAFELQMANNARIADSLEMIARELHSIRSEMEVRNG